MSSSEIICNGRTIVLPSLEVVKTIPKMSAGPNIDWLLHTFYARRDFVRCRMLIERELYQHLNPEYLYFVKGLIDREEGNNIEALRNLQKAIDLNSKNIETYKEIGKTLFIMGRFNQALSVFRESEELSQRADHEIFHYIGELLYRSAVARNQLDAARQDEAEAKLYFQKAVQCGKKLESFQRLAGIHRKAKEYGKAIEVLETCLQLFPENTEVLTEIGVLYLKMNETQKAFDRLLEVINVDAGCSKGLLAFGAILQSRNDVDGALGKYKQITIAEPESAELWNNIGLCFFKKRKFIVAISSLRKAVWFAPLNYNALYNLSLLLISAQQYASAFHTLAAAINLRKDSAECYMLLGICLRKLEDNENAFTAFERSSSIQSQDGAVRNPLIYLNFALFCYETGRIAMAVEQYNRFMSNSQDLILPTDYKFQATKLKSLLKISTSNILYSATSPTQSQSQSQQQLQLQVEQLQSQQLISHHHHEGHLRNLPVGPTIAVGQLSQPQEIPFEVNAVVNAVEATTPPSSAAVKASSSSSPPPPPLTQSPIVAAGIVIAAAAAAGDNGIVGSSGVDGGGSGGRGAQ